MRHTFDGYNYVIRLEKGDRLAPSLEQFMADTKIEGAWVSGIGAAREVALGYYDLGKKEYRWQTFSGLFELTSLQGNLAKDESGAMMFHLHGTFSGPDFQIIGGHVKDFITGGTVELFVHRTYQPLQRKSDPGVGLPLLDV